MIAVCARFYYVVCVYVFKNTSRKSLAGPGVASLSLGSSDALHGAGRENCRGRGGVGTHHRQTGHGPAKWA